ncbi:MAG: ShlB/FhaC/HecB family hemolysin secretion/activation protein [Leptolyngbya sp. SIO1D8]|nr:ShlB/FhaC/HecB family hemolysin secretion/activation protein [Leptolyngbya sp. SIO1D8]
MKFLAVTPLLLSLLIATPTLAQPVRPNPNQDRLPQPLPDPEDAIPPDTTSPITPTTPPTTDIPGSDVTVSVTQIEVIGSTVFTATDFEPLVSPLEGRDASLNELQALAEAITQLYFEQGYLTSRAVLSEQEVTDGTIQIQVIEGTISDIQIEGNQQTNTSYLKRRLALGTGTPAQLGAIEDQLRLLQLNPLFDSVAGTLLPGEGTGETILQVTVDEAKPFNADLSVDNYSPPSIGDVRTGVALSYRNLTGWGDQISVAYSRSTTGGSNLYDLGYRIPLNAMEGTLQLRALFSDSTQTQTSLDIDGYSEFYEASFRQPLIRTPREEFALSLGFAYREGQTFLFDSPFPFGIGPDDNGISRTSVFKFGQDYIRRDLSGAWALQSQFSFGTGLFNATQNAGSTPDGQFFSWLGQFQRVQRLGVNNLLIVQGSAQLTPNSLLASEQFVMGGGQSIRGFRQNVRSGDNGFRLSVEDRITILRDQETSDPIMQLTPFVDLGYVWNQANNPNVQPTQRFLAGAGLGIILTPTQGLQMKFDYGVPLVDLSDQNNNIQDNGFYFSVNYHY